MKKENKGMIIKLFLAGVFLLICTFTDLKNKQVSVWICILFFILGIGFNILCSMEHQEELKDIWKDTWMGLLPGIILLGFSVTTKECIGKGDGLVMVAMGILLGVEKTIALFMISLFLSAIVAAFLIGVRRVEKNYEIPFVPFLTVGMCLMLLEGVL